MTNKGGRKAGTPNKRSQLLLRKLEDDHNFRIVDELVAIFRKNKEMMAPILEKMAKNQMEKKALNDGFSGGEMSFWRTLSKENLRVLTNLLAYCFPKLKAMEINADTGEKIVFNISGLDVAATKG